LPPSGAVRKMRLFIAADAACTEFRPIMEAGYSLNLNRGALTLVEANDMTIIYPESYPSGSDKVLNLGDAEAAQLTYTYSGDATYQRPDDYKWVSSATIRHKLARQLPATGC